MIKNSLIAAAIIIAFLLGRYSKQCPEIINTVVEEKYVPITGGIGSPIVIAGKPKNVYIHDTVKIKVKGPTFYSTDTLRFDSIIVMIKDTGNAEGIINRGALFGGKVKEKIITNTVIKPAPLLQLDAGIRAQFDCAWQANDIGPAAQLQIKNKYSLGYSYMINNRSHNVSLLVKLK